MKVCSPVFFAFELDVLKEKMFARFQQGLYSSFARYAFRRFLSVPIDPPRAKIPIKVRRFSESDLDAVLPMDSTVSSEEKLEISSRRSFYRRFPKGCYAGVDLRTDTPCYIQWLISSSDNDFLQKFKCFPCLKNDEALLEHAYTPPSYRGLGIMPEAMFRIAEEAKLLGVDSLITFVRTDNFASVKGCMRAGFRPYMLQRNRQFLFGTVVRNKFEELVLNDPKGLATFNFT